MLQVELLCFDSERQGPAVEWPELMSPPALGSEVSCSFFFVTALLGVNHWT